MAWPTKAEIEAKRVAGGLPLGRAVPVPAGGAVASKGAREGQMLAALLRKRT